MRSRGHRARRATFGSAVLVAAAGSALAAMGACAGQTAGNTGFPSGSSGGSSGSGSSSSGQTTSSSSGGQGSSSGNAGSSGSSGAGGSSGTAGSSSGTTGSSSGPPTGIVDAGGGSCATNKVVVAAANPVLIDFDSYTGTTSLLTVVPYGPNFPAGGYTGPFNYAAADGGSDGVLSMVTGRTGGVLPNGGTDWAIDLSVKPEAQYNNAIGLWISPCANATAFKGVSFWARGTMPSFQLQVIMNTYDTGPVSGGGLCTGTCNDPTAKLLMDASLPVTFPVWTQIQLPWSAFAGGIKNGAAFTPTGDNITGIQFQAFNVLFPPIDASADGSIIYGQVPSDLDLQIDDVVFTP